MLLKPVDTVCLEEDQLFDGFDISFELIHSSLHSDDIWKKFEFLDELLFTDSEEPDAQLDSLLEWNLDAAACGSSKEAREIRHHDCMWAGHCGSKEHKPDTAKLSTNVIIVKPPVQNTPNTTSVKKSNSIAAPTNLNQGRSLLLTSRNVTPITPVCRPTTNGSTQEMLPPAAVGHIGPRPDSPPSSDDDDHPRFKHEMAGIFTDTPVNKTLQLLNDAFSECDLTECDSDLCEYFEDSDMFTGTDGEVSSGFPGESDHSYHKGKGSQNHNQHRMDHLGVQTPSDSEEEIDVVSIGEKQTSNTNRCLNTILPTNPTIRDRQKLQRTVASAISNKREYNQTCGIKTRLPLRIPDSSSPPSERTATLKKRAANDGRGTTTTGRGVKRARHYRYQKGSPGTSPNKRRHPYGQSSDSETECSEKRSLHNNMERQRRVDLRNAFDDLRVLVPEVACKERAAKVVILREAAAYCDFLSSQSAGMAKQVSEMRKQQERLRARVSQLRRSLAAKR